MINCEITYENGKVVIRIDPAKRFGLTSSGKNHMIASTQGTAPLAIPGLESGLYINMTLHKRRTFDEILRSCLADA